MPTDFFLPIIDQNRQPDQNGPAAPQGPDSHTQGQINGAPQVGQPNEVVTPGQGVQGQDIGTGFVNLQSLLMANAPSAAGMAQKLVDKTYNAGSSAQQTGDRTKAREASGRANALGSFPGIEASLQDEYGQNAYTEGQSGFDAMLAGNAGQKAFNSAQQAYGGLYQQLMNAPEKAPAGAKAVKYKNDGDAPDATPANGKPGKLFRPRGTSPLDP